jgi:ATP phosphoribosyltransferase
LIDIVLPKGSLEQETLRLFDDADLPIIRASSRDYNAKINDLRIGNVKFLRPQEIALYVQQSYFDLGITGQDWVAESGADVVDVMPLEYNKSGVGAPVKLVLAVSQESGVSSVDQLPPNLRVSTEYPKITEGFFRKIGVPAQVFLSYGATEAKVPQIADAVVELTETGQTLRRNGMCIIDTVFDSATTLIANKESWADQTKRQQIEEITTLLNGALAARGKVLIKLNVSEERLGDVVEVLPAMKAPTVSRLFGSDFYAVETVVVRSEINLLIPELKKRGAEDILELPISKIVI